MATHLKDSIQSIHVDVGFFDQQEEARLLQYPTADRILEIVDKGITVKTAQFLTYYMFHRRRPGKEGFRDYTQLGQRIHHADADLSDWVVPGYNSLVSAQDVDSQDRAITERIGEATALSVVGQIHDIHDADWNRLREYRGRGAFSTFDFERQVLSASDGNLIVQVEAKGTAPRNDDQLSVNLKKHLSDIAEKKKKIRPQEAADRYPHPANLRYGVVTALRPNAPLRCWLTDPPGDQGPDPMRFRLLARLNFIFDWISFLSGRSQFAASLATRLHALLALRDPFTLAGVPLFRGNGKPFSLGPTRFGATPSMFAHLCRVTDGEAVGTLVNAPNEHLFFVGVQRHLFEKAVTQSFDEIMNYRDAGGSVKKTLDCVIPRGRARTMGIDRFHGGPSESTEYITFSAGGELHYSHGGSVFGLVTPD